jgi:hypothetical protein
MKILSVHTPKAGGTSVLRALTHAFGNSLLLEIVDDPAHPTSPRNLDPYGYFSRSRKFPDNIDCIHGHFHPGQFQISRDTFLFTLLRHPVDNLISIYFFWRNLPSHNLALHDYFLNQKLDILATARLPLLRHLYSQTYFGGFDMKRFDIIGRHENRKSALIRLAAAVDRPLDINLHENVTPPSDERLSITTNEKLMAQLHDILADDILFYDQHAK